MKKNNKKAASSKAVKNKKTSGSKTPMYILLGVITFLLVLTVSLAAVYCYTNPATDDENPFGDLPAEEVVSDNKEQQPKEPENKKSADGRNNNMYNLLVVGKDYWSGSTDVLIIMSVNTQNDEINVLQIPRDSTVDCGVNENHGKRVNAIYAYARQALRREASNPSKEYDDPVMAKVAPLYISGLKKATDSEAKKFNDELLDKMGMEYLREVIKRTFCIAIDGYVMVDVSGFRKIVDVLEGVEVDVPMDMHYEDPEQNLYIHLNKGLQTLNGKQAEGFVRYRYGYVDGDIGRVNAQKIFVAALAKKLLSFSTVTKIQPILEACMEYTTTNLSTTSILGYAKIMLGMNMNNIKFYTCPGEAYRTSSGAWYYSLYMDENLEIINQYFNDYDRQVTPDDVTLREVVKNYNISYDNQGITADDIDNDMLDVKHSAVTYNPVDTPASSTVTTPSEPVDEPVAEEKPAEEAPSDENSEDEEPVDENIEKNPDDESPEDENPAQNGDETTEVPDGEITDEEKDPENGEEVTDGEEPAENTEGSENSEKDNTSQEKPTENNDDSEKPDDTNSDTAENTDNGENAPSDADEDTDNGENVTGTEKENTDTEENGEDPSDAEDTEADETNSEENTEKETDAADVTDVTEKPEDSGNASEENIDAEPENKSEENTADLENDNQNDME